METDRIEQSAESMLSREIAAALRSCARIGVGAASVITGTILAGSSSTQRWNSDRWLWLTANRRGPPGSETTVSSRSAASPARTAGRSKRCSAVVDPAG